MGTPTFHRLRRRAAPSPEQCLWVGLALARFVIAAAAALFHVSPLPRDPFTNDELTAAVRAG